MSLRYDEHIFGADFRNPDHLQNQRFSRSLENQSIARGTFGDDAFALDATASILSLRARNCIPNRPTRVTNIVRSIVCITSGIDQSIDLMASLKRQVTNRIFRDWSLALSTEWRTSIRSASKRNGRTPSRTWRPLSSPKHKRALFSRQNRSSIGSSFSAVRIPGLLLSRLISTTAMGFLYSNWQIAVTREFNARTMDFGFRKSDIFETPIFSSGMTSLYIYS